MVRRAGRSIIDLAIPSPQFTHSSTPERFIYMCVSLIMFRTRSSIGPRGVIDGKEIKDPGPR